MHSIYDVLMAFLSDPVDRYETALTRHQRRSPGDPQVGRAFRRDGGTSSRGLTADP